MLFRSLSKGDRAVFQVLVDELESGEQTETAAASPVPIAPATSEGDLLVQAEGASHLQENLVYFERQLETVDANIIWLGIQQLQVASIALTEGQDNPQLVFESMNSTGKDLSSADLVRNFILMSAPIESQESLYRSFWRPIEQSLDTDNGAELFEKLRDRKSVV